jgi:hypothetical protein
MDLENKIKNIIKQNDAIYTSLVSKNIEFTRANILSISDNNEKLEILMDENLKLKELSKSARPPPVIKEKVLSVIKEKVTEIQEEESYEEPLKKFDTITNMEDIKRAFFCKDYDLFETLIKEHNFKYYSADYKYSCDKDGVQSFIAKNLVKGFVRSLDDYRKYLLVCFRCFSSDHNTYTYPSLWIVNSNELLSEIIGSVYEDFNYTEISDIKDFLNKFRKIEVDNPLLLDEGYVH